MEFLERLMHNIVTDGVLTPKAQVERYLSPMLAIFLEDILKEKFKNDYKMIAPEFPIKKDENNQSTNIDYLMFNQTENKFVFIELKTDSKSFKLAQLNSYKKLECNREIGTILGKNLEDIWTASSYKVKYEHLLKKFAPYNAINTMEIIYIVPEKTKKKIKGTNILSFSDLPEELPSFSAEWKIILKHLKELDKN